MSFSYSLGMRGESDLLLLSPKWLLEDFSKEKLDDQLGFFRSHLLQKAIIQKQDQQTPHIEEPAAEDECKVAVAVGNLHEGLGRNQDVVNFVSVPFRGQT